MPSNLLGECTMGFHIMALQVTSQISTYLVEGPLIVLWQLNFSSCQLFTRIRQLLKSCSGGHTLLGRPAEPRGSRVALSGARGHHGQRFDDANGCGG